MKTFIFAWCAIGLATSLVVLLLDYVQYLRGKNDGDMDVPWLLLNIILWPLSIVVLARTAWAFIRYAFRRRPP